jgi:hypothetical protein
MSMGSVVDFHTHLAPCETIQPSLIEWAYCVHGEDLGGNAARLLGLPWRREPAL